MTGYVDHQVFISSKTNDKHLYFHEDLPDCLKEGLAQVPQKSRAKARIICPEGLLTEAFKGQVDTQNGVSFIIDVI
jgi:hypothetical protein